MHHRRASHFAGFDQTSEITIRAALCRGTGSQSFKKRRICEHTALHEMRKRCGRRRRCALERTGTYREPVSSAYKDAEGLLSEISEHAEQVDTDRIAWPAPTAREISSRSASVKASLERCRCAGCIPPVLARIP